MTRIGWFLSHRLALRLEQDPEVEYILGIDLDQPRGDLQRTEYLRADIRKPVLLKILESTGIDTVVHLGLYSTPGEAGGRGAMHDLNVIGAMQLFAACQRAESVKQVIVRSSTAVYGAESNDPAVFTEDMMRAARTDPFGRDSQEIESYARELSRRRPELDMTTFRFANILGPGADTPLANYLTMPVIPTVLGFDPRLQFIHEDDASDLLVRAIERPVRGVFNASGDGVMYLSQVIRQGGRVEVPLPTPVLKLAAPLFRFAGRSVKIPPHVINLLHWGRVADTTRLRKVFGFEPRRTTRDAVREFYAERRLRRVTRTQQAQTWERELHEFLTRKGQERFLARSRGDWPPQR
jgi:UDP-glucose 4-epimerase